MLNSFSCANCCLYFSKNLLSMCSAHGARMWAPWTSPTSTPLRVSLPLASLAPHILWIIVSEKSACGGVSCAHWLTPEPLACSVLLSPTLTPLLLFSSKHSLKPALSCKCLRKLEDNRGLQHRLANKLKLSIRFPCSQGSWSCPPRRDFLRSPASAGLLCKPLLTSWTLLFLLRVPEKFLRSLCPSQHSRSCNLPGNPKVLVVEMQGNRNLIPELFS